MNRENRKGSVTSMMSGDYGFGDAVDSQAEGERSQRASQVSGQYGFGPDPGGTGDASKVWLHNAVLPDKTKFYHGRVETDEAEALLLAEEEKTGRHVRGRFLLRENKLASMLSEDADEHYLSVVEDEGSVKHFLIQRQGEVYAVDGIVTPSCKTLSELVEHLKGEGDPPLTVGLPGLQVITSDRAEEIDAERRMATLALMQEKIVAPPPTQENTDISDAIVGGASGLAVSDDDVAAFQRGQGANTPMFLPSSSVAADKTRDELYHSADFTLAVHLHTFASALEADGCLLDVDHAGTAVAGTYCIRPGTKKEGCTYVVHVVKETPTPGQPTELLDVVKQHKINAKGDGVFDVDGVYEIDGYTSFEEVVNEFLTGEQDWWSPPLRKVIGPVADRSRAKQIEKSQKVRAKQWQDQLKKIEKETRTLERQQKKESKRLAKSMKRDKKTEPVLPVVVDPVMVEVVEENEHPIWNELENFEATPAPATPPPNVAPIHEQPVVGRAVYVVGRTEPVVVTMRPKKVAMIDQNRDSVDADAPVEPQKRWSNANELFGQKRSSYIPEAALVDTYDPTMDPEAERVPSPPPPVEHLVAGTKSNQKTKAPKSERTKHHPHIANHVLPNSTDKRSVQTRRANQQHAIAPPLVNEQARGAPELIGKPSVYSTTAREMQRQDFAQEMANKKVNEQVRGAPEFIGKPNNFGTDSADMARAMTAPRVRRTNPNVMVDSAVSRDKQADASWAAKPLQAGERHEVAEAQYTIDFSQAPAKSPEPPEVKETKENFTQFYFEGLEKEEAISLLKMVDTAGAFVIIPDAQRTRLKFSLIFFHNGKVTSHGVVRQNVGGSFTIGCSPYMLINQELGHATPGGACTEMTQVVAHLQTAQQYWPHKLKAGIEAPTQEAEYIEMMNSIGEYQKNVIKRQKTNVKKSRRLSENRMSDPSLAGKRWTVAPKLADKLGAIDDGGGDAGEGAAEGGAATEPPAKPTFEAAKAARVAQADAAEQQMVQPAGTMSGETFLHSNCNKRKAERLLLQGNGRKPDGKFLIRQPASKGEAEGPGDYIFSVVSKQKVQHHVLAWNAEKDAYVLNGVAELKCKTLEDLLTMLVTKQPKWTVPLTQGIMSPDAEKREKANRKLAANADTDDVTAELAPRRTAKYLLTIHTSNVSGAGTDGMVSLDLVGDEGAAETGLLKFVFEHARGAATKTDIFTQGSAKSFTLRLPDVGILQKVRVSLVPRKTLLAQASTKVVNWNIEKITAEKHGAAGQLAEKYSIDCQNTWVVANEQASEFAVNADEDESEVFDHDSDNERDGDGVTAVHFRTARKHSVAHARNKRNGIMNREHHLKNANMPGAPELVGEATNYNTGAKEMQRLKYSQEIAWQVNSVNEQVRGELAGGQHSYGAESAEMSRQINAPKVPFLAPQALLPGIFSRDKVADAIHGTKQFANTDDEVNTLRAESVKYHGKAKFA